MCLIFASIKRIHLKVRATTTSDCSSNALPGRAGQSKRNKSGIYTVIGTNWLRFPKLFKPLQLQQQQQHSSLPTPPTLALITHMFNIYIYIYKFSTINKQIQ